MNIKYCYYQEVREFYDQLARRYDQIYPFSCQYNEELCQGLDGLFKEYGIKKILDCACGTGNPLIGLAKLGYEVVGTDISEGMLKQARENARTANVPDIRFLQINLLDLSKDISEKFDCVLCRGNSLSHLLPEDFERALKNMYDVLNKGGICYVDTRRWEEIVRNKPRCEWMSHTTSEDGDVLSFYLYDYAKDFRIYNIHVLCLKETNEDHTSITHEKHKIKGYYVFEEDLIQIMKKAGFSKVTRINVEGELSHLDVYLGHKK